MANLTDNTPEAFEIAYSDTIRSLEFEKVLYNLSKYLTSPLSKKECLTPAIFNTPEKINYELDLTDEARKIIDDYGTGVVLDCTTDIENTFRGHTYSASELYDLALALRCARISRNFILSKDFKNLNAIASNLYCNKELEDSVFNILDSDLNVKDDASDVLKSLRNSLRDNKENLKIAIQNLLKNPAFCDNLQDTIVTSRDGRTVFQVKASSKNKVQGIVHDVSQSNLTYFIEPASLVPLSNRIRQVEIEIRAEVERILRELSEKFKTVASLMIQNQKILIKLDIVFARAKYSIHLRAQRADLASDKILDIQAMRHPLLVEIKEKVIENDLVLGKNYKTLLITGSNTGGKTVVLKCAGLMVLMTKAGLHVPCLGAKIYPFKNIFCDISTEQSLEQGFSTFSAHIENIKNILDKTDSETLVLLDELGSGTDPEEGAALSRAILSYIKSKNASSIITTHLGALKTLKFEDDYFENATVTFNLETLEPEYKLITGVSGMSNAIDISSKLGLNPDIIDCAREYLKNLSNPKNQTIAQIEHTAASIVQKEELAKQELEAVQKTNLEAKEKLGELNKNKKKSLDTFKKKFQTRFDMARDEIKQIVDEIRKEKSIKVAARAYNRLNRLEDAIREEFSDAQDKISQKYKELDLEKLKIGQNVLIKKLEQVVILNSLPDKKGNVEIKIGNITSKINISRLAVTDKKIAPHLKKIEVHFDNSDNLLSRLDLRGMRVDEALDFLDKSLDRANLRGLNQVSVITGHGTGALKRAVGEYLKDSPYVSKYRYGAADEGRDGIVIVDLV